MVFAQQTAPGTGQADLRVIHNALVDDNSIVLFDTTNALVSHNKSERAQGTAMLPGGLTGSEVSHNRLEDGTASEIVLADFLGAGGENPSVLISQNHVSSFARDGMGLRATSAGNTVQNNHTDRNGRDGIRVSAGATGNTLQKNHMKNNVEHDAHDDNRPANTWINNHCDTDFPPRTICK